MRLASECVTTYPPLGDYALIGDCRGAGLVARDGSLDWLCVPRFDSPSIFAALLDAETGGRFRIRPTADGAATRRYLPDTNILEKYPGDQRRVFLRRDCSTQSHARLLTPDFHSMCQLADKPVGIP